MRRLALGAVVGMALFAAATGAAQPAKTGAPKGTAAPKTTAAPAASTAPKTGAPTGSGTAAASGSAAPAVTGVPSGAATSAPATSGTAAPSATPATSGSAEPAAPVPEDAGVLFQKAREAFKADSFASALELFRKSYAIDPSAGTLLNIALTEEKLGKPASALADFQRVTGLFKSDDDRMPIAREGVSRTTLSSPHLKLARAAGAPPTMAIRVDGAAMEANMVGVEQPIDPGPHVITTSVFGFEERTYDIKLTEGQHLSMALEPGKRILVAAPVQTAQPQDAPNGARLASLAVFGAGIAGLGVGVVTGILAISKKGDLDSTCPRLDACTSKGIPCPPNVGECTAAGLRTLGEAHTLADVSTGTFIFGGIAAVGGAVLFMTVGGGKSLFVTASPTPGGAAMTASGRF